MQGLLRCAPLRNDLAANTGDPTASVWRSGCVRIVWHNDSIVNQKLVLRLEGVSKHRKLREWFIFFQIHDTDKRQVAIIFIEVKAVAEDKFVWYIESAIMDGYHCFASF